MTFFYNLNQKLNSIESAPESKQLNERDMGKHNNATTGFKALAKKAGGGEKGEKIAGAQFQKMKKAGQLEETNVDEGLGDAVKKVGGALKTGYNKLAGGDDHADVMRGLQKKMNLPQTGMKPGAEPNPKQIKEKMSPAKAKSFAALAEPKDKITFADKIAGAKKEVDEMLGDVAAEAMKAALGNGKTVVADEDSTPKVGDVTHGAKHDIEHTATGRKVTRRADDQGISVGSETDDEGNKHAPRGRGRPKGPAKGTERVTGKATKHKGEREKKGSAGSVSDSGKALQGFMIGNKPSKPVGKVSVKHKMKEGDFGPMEEDSGELKAAMALLKKAGYKVSKEGREEVDEKAVSKKQQKFMGMVHATQKGEKAPSKEVAKVAKSMKKSDAEDFASTKHKGLPEKKKPEGKKKEKTEEAGGTGTPTASSGFSYGKGIYDSLNRDLENAITESMSQLNESMSVNMSDSTEGGKSLTITATDDDALQLATLLKSAGLGNSEMPGDAHGHDEGCAECGQAECECGDEHEIEIDEVSMNEPDYPTNTEEGNALEYSGGLNGPKSTGQSTVPVLASQDDRQHSYAEAEEDAIKRMMEMAGIKEGKKPDFLDVDKDGDEKESFKKAVDDKKEKKVDEGILASTRALWKKYQG